MKSLNHLKRTNIRRVFLFFLIILFPFKIFPQQLSGLIKDSNGNSLPNANVIAKPLQTSANIKFSIANQKGQYELVLDDDTDYEIKVSFIGFKEEVLLFKSRESIKTHNFILSPKSEQLDEIILTHKYEPIIIKKDTISFKINTFTSGTERKLGDQLEKLPGVEVDSEGNVIFQGKRVTRLLVEDSSFFGGGTKLGVQNIPAGVVDEVEFIDYFNETAFMKEVSESNELAINVKLKEDKKSFVFGDLQAGYGLDNYNVLHANLFYYSKKLNLVYIGDNNNFGQKVFTFDDVVRFQGGYSTYLSNRKNYGNLYEFSTDQNRNVVNKSLFNAFNINYKIDSFDIQGYTLFSKSLQKSSIDNSLTYLQTLVEESRISTTENKNQLLNNNFKVNFSQRKNIKWYYNIYNEISNLKADNIVNSFSSFQNSTLNNLLEADDIVVRQYVERHQKHNVRNTSTFVISHNYNKNRPFQTWISNEPFLNGLIPLEVDQIYNVKKIQRTTTNSTEILFKHYWTLNSANHLYSSIGSQINRNSFSTIEKQVLSDQTVNDFSINGFGNEVSYSLNDYFIEFEYKLNLGKWINRPKVSGHFYDLSTNQYSQNQSYKRFYIEPELTSEFNFNDTEKLYFNYVLKNEFPSENLFAENSTIQNFNNIFRGNALLQNERFQQYSLNYLKSNFSSGWIIFANMFYINKMKSIRNSIEFEGINILSTPILLNAPENNWSINTNISKQKNNITLGLSTSLNGFSYLQEIDSYLNRNERTSQRLGLSIKNTHKKLPNFKLTYTHGLNQLRGIQENDFQTQNFIARFDYKIYDKFIFKFDYDWTKNSFENRKDKFDRLNFSLQYMKENNPWSFEIQVNNAFNIKSRFNNSFSDFFISMQETFIMPRVVVFSIHYKL